MNIDDNKLWLANELDKFSLFVKSCIDNTKFKNDLKLYKSDLELILKWLNDINSKNITFDAIAANIIDPQTVKKLTNDWRQGEWGDKHHQTYMNLISEIEKRL